MNCFGCLKVKNAENKTTNESLACEVTEGLKDYHGHVYNNLDEVNTKGKAFVIYRGNGC